MINNDSLSERLNAIKNNKEFPNPNNSKQAINSIETIGFIVMYILSVFKMFVYGFALKTIFSTNWNFFEFSVIGLAFVLLLNYIKLLIHKI